MDDELQKIASELYGLPIDEFVAKRDHLSSEKRKEKNKALADAIKALVKPTMPAWVVNQMVRHQADVTDLLQLGEQMRKAQETLQGEELRKLSSQRAALLKEMGKQAQALARKLDHPISDEARDEVVATLSAALADPDASEQVRAGQLTRSIHYSGFGLPLPAEPQAQSVTVAEAPKHAAPSQTETKASIQAQEPEPQPPHEHKPRTGSRTERAAEAERKMAAAREALRIAEEESAAIRKEEEEAARLLEHARQEAEIAADAEQEASQAYERSKNRVHHLQEQLQAAQAELDTAEATLQETKVTNRLAQEQLYEAEKHSGHE